MPRKGENIYKRKDGRWEGRYIKSRTSTGKAIYGYVYAKTYREVKEKLIKAAFSKPKADYESPEKTKVIFKNVALEWMEFMQPHLKESTSNKYWNLLNTNILPIFGDQSLENITYQNIEESCNYLLRNGGAKGKGLSAKTVSDILSIIKNIVRFASRKGNTVAQDVLSVQIKHPPKEMRVFSRSEQDKLCLYLCENLDPCNLGILMCLFTGLRVGEICALRWEDISMNDHTIHVHQTLQRVQDRSNPMKKTKVVVTSPKSQCSIRTIPLPDELFTLIAERNTPVSGYFLTSSNQKYLEPRTMQNRFKQVLKKSSIEPANFHTLRHTFATRCIEIGFDVKSLSEILGHANVNITLNRYVHPSLELKKENMQRLSKFLAVK